MAHSCSSATSSRPPAPITNFPPAPSPLGELFTQAVSRPLAAATPCRVCIEQALMGRPGPCEERLQALKKPRIEIKKATSPILIGEMKIHKALALYDNFHLPQDTSLLILCGVSGNVEELEHLIHFIKRLIKMKQKENFSVLIFLVKEDETIPQNVYQQKMDVLRSLATTLEACLIEHSEDNLIDVSSLDLPIHTTITIGIGIMKFDFKNDPEIGRITDDLEEDNDNIYDISGFEHIDIGFTKGTCGIWVEDDDAFNSIHQPLGESIQTTLFGAALPDEGKDSWEVGFGSFDRSCTDFDRLAWLYLRLSQASSLKNCALALPAFDNPILIQTQLTKLCETFHFNRCEVVDTNGNISSLFSKDSATPRALRIIYQFIPENDLISVIQRAKEGSLVGSENTTYMRGFAAKYPPFIPHSFFKERGRNSLCYLKDNRFPLVARWLEKRESLTNKNILDWTQECHNPELLQEWKRLTLTIKKEFDFGIWAERYIKRCVFEKKCKDIATSLEAAFCKEDDPRAIDFQEYQAGIYKRLSPYLIKS